MRPGRQPVGDRLLRRQPGIQVGHHRRGVQQGRDPGQRRHIQIKIMLRYELRQARGEGGPMAYVPIERLTRVSQ
jgi:hypothetical protein